jgi:hypothetical protein
MHRKKSPILNASHELLLAVIRSEKRPNTFVSGEQYRRALANSGVTVVAHITKDRELVAWAQGTSRAVYIAQELSRVARSRLGQPV